MATPFRPILIFVSWLVLASCLSAPAAERRSISINQNGWRIVADAERGYLTVGHESLGAVLEQVQLWPGGGSKVGAPARWESLNRSGEQLIVTTARQGGVWTFECRSNELRITSTATGATLSARAPVTKARRVARLLDRGGTPVTWEGTGEVEGSYGGQRTRNPSFLPRRNPECMYFALGQVAASTFHSLFDQTTDTGIDFPEATRLQLRGAGAKTLDLSMPIEGEESVRLLTNYFTTTLGVPFYAPLDDSIFSRAPMVWCSWTSYYGDVTEDAVIRNTDWLARNLKPYGFQYVQIDDGYDRGAKDGHYWIENWDPQKFPKGPAWIARYIKSKGLHPGLWLVPNAYAGAVERHPDWYLRDRQGKIVDDYGTPALDSSNPEVLDFLKHLFGTLKGWGFDYYKFDGEHALPKYAPPVDRERLHDRGADPLTVYRHRLDLIRGVLGAGTFIEGCPAGTPLNGIGYFNSYFNGQDVYNNWHGMYSLFNSINANAFLNHIAVYVMPGEGMELGERLSVEEAAGRRPAEVVNTARSREEPVAGFGVTTAEARTLVSLVSLSGVVYPLAGVMPELPPDRLALIEQTMPTMPIRPIDLFSRGGDADWDTFKHVSSDDYVHHYPEIVDLKVNASSGTYDVVALPNWRGTANTKAVSLPGQLGLDAKREYVAFDFWNKKLLGTFSNRMDLEVESHDTRVLLLHPSLDRPQLIGNSRHITGAFSIENARWDPGRHALKGISDVIPGADYTLFVRVPARTKTNPKVSATAGNRAVKARQSLSGELLSVSFSSEKTPVNWQIRF